MCVHSHCTTARCAMTLELVVGLTLRTTVLVEFEVDEVAVRHFFVDTAVSHVSIFQLVLHTHISLSQTPYDCTIESVTA